MTFILKVLPKFIFIIVTIHYYYRQMDVLVTFVKYITETKLKWYHSTCIHLFEHSLKDCFAILFS